MGREKLISKAYWHTYKGKKKKSLVMDQVHNISSKEELSSQGDSVPHKEKGRVL